jgi:predicted nucleic acid-binding protein
MKKKLYIETSVWNQLEHTDRPEWRTTAKQFIATLKAAYYDAYISFVVLDEIGKTSDEALKTRLMAHIEDVKPTILEFDDEALGLADQYMATAFNGKHSTGIYNDCSHVAIATINGIKHIVSFNCKHLVNDQRIDGFNAINLQNGYDHIVDICTPEKFNRLSME